MPRGSVSIPAGPMCWSAISAGGDSTPRRWGLRPTGSNRLFSNRSDALRIVRDVGLGVSIGCRH